jgi:bacterioferritin-associated ferredoxin
MKPDDEVCLCFHVSLRKIRAYLKREDPPVASLISECLGAGTGCQWCVPILRKLHAQHRAGEIPELRVSAEQYASGRAHYRKTGDRSETETDDAGPNENGPDGDPSGPGMDDQVG